MYIRIGGIFARVPTLTLDPAPPQPEALLEHGRAPGGDIFDKAWERIYHLTPSPDIGRSLLGSQLAVLLTPPARAGGLSVSEVFNLGHTKDDFRPPTSAYTAVAPRMVTAAIVVEIVSPGDESWKKLPFYARHQVDEVLIVDPATRSLSWLALEGGEYRAAQRSRIIDRGTQGLAERIAWPKVG